MPGLLRTHCTPFESDLWHPSSKIVRQKSFITISMSFIISHNLYIFVIVSSAFVSSVNTALCVLLLFIFLFAVSCYHFSPDRLCWPFLFFQCYASAVINCWRAPLNFIFSLNCLLLKVLKWIASKCLYLSFHDALKDKQGTHTYIHTLVGTDVGAWTGSSKGKLISVSLFSSSV